MKKIIKEEATATIVEKKSKFISYIKPIKTQEEANLFVEKIKKKYFDARHHCFAYKIGDQVRAADDGEPQGTAGKPILNVIMANQIDKVIIVVVRYFGGILLGTGGLVRAYTKAAKLVCEESKILTVIYGEKIAFRISYKDEPYLRRMISDLSNYGYIKIEEAIYLDKCTITVVVEEAMKENLKSKIFDKLNGNVEIETIANIDITLE